MGIKKRLVLLGLSCWAFVSCHFVATALTATSTPHPTNTAQPTTTSLPTNTSTPEPIPTPIPSTPTIPPPDILTKHLENVRIVEVNPFDNSSGWGAAQEISNGVLTLSGSGGDSWYGIAYDGSVREGSGVVINFKFSRGAFFEMFLENGSWNSDPYKRFGLYVNQGHANADLFSGAKGRGAQPVSGNLSLRPDTGYSLFIVVGKGGDFLALIWDPADPDRNLRYREIIKNWKEINWTFRIQVNQGTIIFDDFEKVEFDSIK